LCEPGYLRARGLGLGLPFDSFVFTLAEDRGVIGFSPPANDHEQWWPFVELEPVPDVLGAVAVLAAPETPPVLHLHHGFPWGRATPRLLPLPEPAKLLVQQGASLAAAPTGSPTS
jgi:4'-phosphopantetheinyl transferase